MADIDNIPLDIIEEIILKSYDAGMLWNPEEGASNEDWHTAIRTHLDLAEDSYEEQFDILVDKWMRAQRQTVLLSALVSRILSTAVQHGIQQGTAKHVEGGLNVTDPFLIDLDLFIREYQKIDGAFPIGETEGFRKWNAEPEAQVEVDDGQGDASKAG